LEVLFSLTILILPTNYLNNKAFQLILCILSKYHKIEIKSNIKLINGHAIY